MTREQELKLALTYLIDAHVAAQRVAAAAQKEVDDLAAAIAKARAELNALTLPPEPSLRDRFTAALNASALPESAKMGWIASRAFVSVYASFYSMAEQYGATHPKDIAKLARAITGSRINPPAWMVDPEDETMPPHERRALSQWSGHGHPFTCNDDPCRAKTRAAPGGDAWPLHPKREGGWVCLHCGLHQ